MEKCTLKALIENLTSNPKRIFLMDSIGAFLSATSLMVILCFFEPEFEIPKKMLYFLFVIACILSIYSIRCYYLFDKRWEKHLRTILIANILYCILTITLLAIFRNSVTLLAIIYFILELIIISCIAFIEIKTVKKVNTNN